MTAAIRDEVVRPLAGDERYPRRVGRYLLCSEIASGGAGTVHLGRFFGSDGFTRTVAVKRLHPHHAKDPVFVAAFIEEARLAARIHHPNVADTLDVVREDGEVYLVMEYLAGESLARLLRKDSAPAGVPPAIAVGIMTSALQGLHAAHEATADDGRPLGLVHRDVSPQNIIIGTDGVARVVDFGIAKAAGRSTTTVTGFIQGKASYLSPEQIENRRVDRRADVFVAGSLLWELLTGRPLFDGDSPAVIVAQILEPKISPPSAFAPGIPLELDLVVLRALAPDPADRFASALDFAGALEAAMVPASARAVGSWVELVGGEALRARARQVAEVERTADARPSGDWPILSPPFSTRARRPPPIPGLVSVRPHVIGAVLLVAIAIAITALVVFARRPSTMGDWASGPVFTASSGSSPPVSGGVTGAVARPASEAPVATAGVVQAGELPSAEAIPTITKAPAPKRGPRASVRHASDCSDPYVHDHDVKILRPECVR